MGLAWAWHGPDSGLAQIQIRRSRGSSLAIEGDASKGTPRRKPRARGIFRSLPSQSRGGEFHAPDALTIARNRATRCLFATSAHGSLPRTSVRGRRTHPTTFLSSSPPRRTDRCHALQCVVSEPTSTHSLMTSPPLGRTPLRRLGARIVATHFSAWKANPHQPIPS
jgi:hypothetical protein